MSVWPRLIGGSLQVIVLGAISTLRAPPTSREFLAWRLISPFTECSFGKPCKEEPRYTPVHCTLLGQYHAG